MTRKNHYSPACPASYVAICVAVIVVLGLSRRAYADAGLVAHYSFEEGKGAVAKDTSGNGNHGKILGGAEWVKGPCGGALSLNGKDGYIDCGTGWDKKLPSAATFMIWCRAVTPQGG